jgi:diguanylate cyclase (GGDEF)-like protein
MYFSVIGSGVEIIRCPGAGVVKLNKFSPAFAGKEWCVRTLARAAVTSLKVQSAALALVVAAVTVLGVLGTSSSARRGNEIASDELTTSTATGQLARDINAAYATGEQALLVRSAAQRSRLLDSVYRTLLPAADTELAALERLHASDPPAERAGFQQFVRQWTAVRDLLSPTDVTAHPDPALAARLAGAYYPVSAHLDRLLVAEQGAGRRDQAAASANTARITGYIIGAAVLGLGICLFLLIRGVRRIRRDLEPGEERAEFIDTLQVASGEDEAHRLLRHHLERVLPATDAVVLNRNNSADRLEAVTALPDGSPLARTLRGAEPRSCLAVRTGRTHRENERRAPLLSCPVCASCPGASACVPLTVGGEVIGSVLLNRPAPYHEDEEDAIYEAVRQAAPVLANLRNLAVAELRAATDGLTGLPNKRAVTNALKRMFAQALTTGSPLVLLLLDLDHFKQINDQRGHPVGDDVLASVGAVLRSVLRTTDFAGRDGGEEFAILLPETEVPTALEIAERVRAAIAEISLPGSDVSVTASIGISSFPDHASTLERLQRLADAALYVAKRHGRNRIEVAEPGPGTAGPEPVPISLTAAPVPPAAEVASRRT